MQKQASLPVRAARRFVALEWSSRTTKRPSRTFTRAALVLLGTFCLSAPASTQGTTESITELGRLPPARADYPTPKDPNVLFYVQRSSNSNTVVYAARLDASGRLNQDSPVEVYWRRFDSDGRRKSLSFAERNMAFGVESKAMPGRQDAAIVNVVSYPARKAVVELDEKGQPRAVIDMGNRRAKLAYAFIQLVDDDASIPSIAYVDLYGIDLANGRALRERIRPGKAAGR